MRKVMYNVSKFLNIPMMIDAVALVADKIISMV